MFLLLADAAVRLQPLNTVQTVCAVIVGIAVMAGALIGYNKYRVDGAVATIFSLLGLLIAAFGIGGIELINVVTKR